MKLRLLISGSKRNTNTVSMFICRNFDATIEFEELSFHDKFSWLLEPSWQRLIYRFFPGILTSKMDRLFVDQVKKFKPQVVVVFKGSEISKRSLIEIRKLDVKLVNYNFDHPFVHFSKGTGNKFVTEAIPYYDLHISYSSLIADQLTKRYRVPTAVIPFGFHLTDVEYSKVIHEGQQEIKEVCFVGNPDSIRIELIQKLIKESVPVNVYGFGWEHYLKLSELLTVHKPRKPVSFWKDPLEFWKTLRRYRVQLNFFRPHNEGSHNLRTFEVPSVGGVLLTPDSDEQRFFFDDESEIFYYTDAESLIRQCKRLLAMNENEINVIRENTRLRSIQQDYSYKRRTSDLITLLNELVSNHP